MQNNKNNLLYEEESYKIRGCCFKVFNTLGGGIKENIIQRALSIELPLYSLKFEQQKRIDVFYNDKKVGVYIPDFVVENEIIIEIKSKPFITKEDEKQFWGYLKNSKYQLGLLINFSPQKLLIKRFIHTNKTITAD